MPHPQIPVENSAVGKSSLQGRRPDHSRAFCCLGVISNVTHGRSRAIAERIPGTPVSTGCRKPRSRQGGTMRIKSERLITLSLFVAALLVLVVWLGWEQIGEPPARDPGPPPVPDTDPRPDPSIHRVRVPLPSVDRQPEADGSASDHQSAWLIDVGAGTVLPCGQLQAARVLPITSVISWGKPGSSSSVFPATQTLYRKGETMKSKQTPVVLTVLTLCFTALAYSWPATCPGGYLGDYI